MSDFDERVRVMPLGTHGRLPNARRHLVLTLALLPVMAPARAQALDAPNVVHITRRLVTSGQPPAETLGRLASLGFQAVVYLAPNTVSNAVKREPDLLRQQHIEFVHIPIPFGSPNASHVDAVFSALRRLSDKQVLVHCEVNMRASTLVFLYRAIVLKEDPVHAYAAVTAIWSPRGPWRTLIQEQLRTAGVKFEPL
jgi:protein tyrosine phosphatase (PTP) superfamily phosphohydrolase (DUF442 family)